MSYRKIETWEELDALPVGSQIAYNVNGDATPYENGSPFTGIIAFEKLQSGDWKVIEDTEVPMMIGFEQSAGLFKENYDEGDYFSLVVADATEVAA